MSDTANSTESDFADYVDYVDALARRLTPLIALAYFKAMRDLARAVDLVTVIQLLERGGASSINAVIALFLNDQIMAAAFAPMQDALRQVVARSGARFWRDIPAGPSSAVPIARIRFNVLDANVVTAIERYESRVFAAMTDTLRRTVRQAVTDGLRAGVNPRQIAVGLRSVIGLSPTQETWIRNYQAELESLAIPETRAALRAALTRGDMPTVLQRVLSDGNFDRTVRAAIVGDASLDAGQIETGIARYRKSLTAYQAESTSRTITLNAMREAQRAAWMQAIDAGRVPADDLEETWITTLDGRERPTHHQMHGTRKAFAQDWIVPGVGRQRYPGESEYNCRCQSWIAPQIRSL